MSVTALRHRSSAAALDPRAWLAAASLDGNTPLSIRGSRLVADEAPKGVDAQAQQDALATAVLEFCRGSPEVRRPGRRGPAAAPPKARRPAGLCPAVTLQPHPRHKNTGGACPPVAISLSP